jgi:lipoyl(octanoyl) transferase
MNYIKNKNIFFIDLGKIDYKIVWFFQKKIFNKILFFKNINKKITPNYLLFTEHNHVYTLGKNGKYKNFFLSKKLLKKVNAKFYKIDRGGDITYHGPGQLVVYPILDMNNFFFDIHKYFRFLEEIIIRTLLMYGIKGYRSIGETGVWINIEGKKIKKIGAIGIRISRWVTMHGFSLNVNTNLKYFKNIIQCGIYGKKVSSIKEELNYKISMTDIKSKIKNFFKEIFEITFLNYF